MARPKALTDRLKAEICVRIVDGETVSAICSEAHMPARSTVFKALGEDAAFSDQYARAREIQLHRMEDELLEIADGATSDTVQEARLKVDTRKWIMSKRAPRKYGDRIQQEIEASSAPEAVPVIYIRSSAVR